MQHLSKALSCILLGIIFMSISGCNGGASSSTPPTTLPIDTPTTNPLPASPPPANLSNLNSINSYSLNQSPGIIHGNKIIVDVPFGTNLNSLVATFSTSGNTVKVNDIVQQNSKTQNNFTNPVKYIVIAANGNIKQYNVVVHVLENSNKEILTYLLNGNPGLITGNNILVHVPNNTNLQTLTATFTVSKDATVQVNDTQQQSGITKNDFSQLLTYTVTAIDGTNKKYTVVVTPNNVINSSINTEFYNLQLNFTNCSKKITCDAFWKYGMSANIILTSLLMPVDLNPNFKPIPVDFVNLISDTYLHFTVPGGYWNDDFEWWAIAAQRVLSTESIKQNTNLIASIDNLKNENWLFTQAGTNAWELCTASPACKSAYASFKPEYSGGVWNAYFKYSDYDSRAHSDPTSNQLGTKQNTVTNMLYAVYASRAALTNENITEYNNISNFLNSWRNDPISEHKMLNYINSDTALVRERVYVTGDSPTPDIKGFYNPDLAWIGDQGITLGWLVQILESPKEDPFMSKVDALNMAKTILNGVDKCFIDNNNHILQWTHIKNGCTNSLQGIAPGYDDQDYNTGIGVFLEYLVEAYQTNNELNEFIRLHTRFPAIIANDAYAVNKTQTPYNTCRYNSCTALTASSNNLALYNAYQIIGY